MRHPEVGCGGLNANDWAVTYVNPYLRRLVLGQPAEQGEAPRPGGGSGRCRRGGTGGFAGQHGQKEPRLTRGDLLSPSLELPGVAIRRSQSRWAGTPVTKAQTAQDCILQLSRSCHRSRRDNISGGAAWKSGRRGGVGAVHSSASASGLSEAGTGRVKVRRSEGTAGG